MPLTKDCVEKKTATIGAIWFVLKFSVEMSRLMPLVDQKKLREKKITHKQNNRYVKSGFQYFIGMNGKKQKKTKFVTLTWLIIVSKDLDI